jgi:hypothetical protein
MFGFRREKHADRRLIMLPLPDLHPGNDCASRHEALP